jgi:hypothetical protein
MRTAGIAYAPTIHSKLQGHSTHRFLSPLLTKPVGEIDLTLIY